jgi:hypothetical protein
MVTPPTIGLAETNVRLPKKAKRTLNQGALHIHISFTLGGSDGGRIRLFHLEGRTHPGET